MGINDSAFPVQPQWGVGRGRGGPGPDPQRPGGMAAPNGSIFQQQKEEEARESAKLLQELSRGRGMGRGNLAVMARPGNNTAIGSSGR